MHKDAELQHLSEDLASQDRSRHPSTCKRIFIYFLAFIGILSGAVFLTHASLQPTAGTAHTETPTSERFDLPVQRDDRGSYTICPRDPILRAAANCSFDLLLNGWFPPPCFDAEMHHDFVDGHEYGFFMDSEATVRVPQSEILAGDIDLYPHGLWVTFEEHHFHCEYLLNASFRAIANPDAGIADVFLAPGHMQHCLRLMGQSRPLDSIETAVRAFFHHHKCYLSLSRTFLPVNGNSGDDDVKG